MQAVSIYSSENSYKLVLLRNPKNGLWGAKLPLMWPQLWVYMVSRAESSQPSELRREGTTPKMQILLFTAENYSDPESTCFVLVLFWCYPLCSFVRCISAHHSFGWREAVPMASKRQSEDTEHLSEPSAAPLQSGRTFQWGAILAAVKDQLPSLDSDNSTVSIGTCLSFSLSSRRISLKQEKVIPARHFPVASMISLAGYLFWLLEHCALIHILMDYL